MVRGGDGAKENGGNSQAGLFLQVIKSVLIISERFHKFAGEMKKDEGKKWEKRLEEEWGNEESWFVWSRRSRLPDTFIMMTFLSGFDRIAA